MANDEVGISLVQEIEKNMYNAFYGDVLRLEEALNRIIDLENSEADDPLDDAISIARWALREQEESGN